MTDLAISRRAVTRALATLPALIAAPALGHAGDPTFEGLIQQLEADRVAHNLASSVASAAEERYYALRLVKPQIVVTRSIPHLSGSVMAYEHTLTSNDFSDEYMTSFHASEMEQLRVALAAYEEADAVALKTSGMETERAAADEAVDRHYDSMCAILDIQPVIRPDRPQVNRHCTSLGGARRSHNLF